MSKRPRPLSSFNPRLIQLLLKAAIEPQRFYAEKDHSPPTLLAKGEKLPFGSALRIASTRWHNLIFSSSQAAQNFKDFMRQSQRLHALRAAMKAENHPETSKVYSVHISLDDRLGMLEIAPGDSGIEKLLDGTAAAAPSPTTEIEFPFDDPLDKIEAFK